MTFSEVIKSLFVKHNDELQRFVSNKLGSPEDAEEVVQDVFYNYMRIDDAEKVENPRAFLYKTANNLALNHLRKSGNRRAHLNTLNPNPQTPSLEREYLAQSDVSVLQENIQRLPEQTQTIFLMNRLDGKTYTEISDELGISVSSVQKHMMKALKFLRKYLERNID